MTANEGDYQGVVAELYDLWFQDGNHHGLEDAAFYRQRIVDGGGLALEVACGTGRLLIPFLAEGLPVEGVDISTDMLARCRLKAEQAAVHPVLYKQSMVDLDLPRRYKTIYLPFCSFQYLQDREDAQRSLSRFYEHLEPGGKLYVSMYVPWPDMPSKNEWRLRRVATRPTDGATVLMHEATLCNRTEQVQTDWYRYEVYQEGQLVRSDLRTMKLRWYYRNEFQTMLRFAGFAGFEAFGDYKDEPAEDFHEAMVFVGTRGV